MAGLWRIIVQSVRSPICKTSFTLAAKPDAENDENFSCFLPKTRVNEKCLSGMR